MESPLSFFGYELQPNKPYTHTPPEGSVLKLSNAALGSTTSEGERVSLICKVDNKEFVIANFLGGKVEHASFDLNFADNHEVIFLVKGDAAVHITGYYSLIDDEDFGDDMEGMYGDDFSDETGDSEDEEVEVPKKQAPKQVQAKQAPKAQPKIEQLPAESDEEKVGDKRKPAPVAQQNKNVKTDAGKKPAPKTETKPTTPQQKKPEQKKPEQKKAPQQGKGNNKKK